jgi:regulation of enolase protein 1 (concanavalin A-like superfamily)
MTVPIATLPGVLEWRRPPHAWQVGPADTLTITAGPTTDWFTDPAGTAVTDTAPRALFVPPDAEFRLSAKVRVAGAAAFDAGVLVVEAQHDLWAKLCLEWSPQGHPTIVTVVTRGVSDDCNGATLDAPEVYLRVARQGATFAFHYSHDGRWWQLVRYFTLGPLARVQLGLSAQSPTGSQCTAVFSEIEYQPAGLEDLRGGV